MESTNLDALREAHIDELCHRMTTCDDRSARLWLCNDLKRAIKALNDDRLARLNDALASVGA